MKLKEQLIAEIQKIIARSQDRAIRSVDTERVLMYWQIGKVIFEEEQQGKDRADYGQYIIKSISQIFQPEFGSGFTTRQLEMNRQFYRTFPNANALRSQFSWTHYRTLIRLENEDKREFFPVLRSDTYIRTYNSIAHFQKCERMRTQFTWTQDTHQIIN